MSGKNVAFIGLGAMGKPMAANLVQAGFAVTVVGHRNPEPVRALRELGAAVAATPAEAAAEADFVVTMVPDSPEVVQVLFGPDGVTRTAHKGLIAIDMSTIAASAARQIGARLADLGIGFLDAPVSGGVRGATAGTLTIMAGGEAEVLEAARPVLEGMGKRIFHAGATGAGQVVKACNNLLVGIFMMANAEMLTLGVKQGVSGELLREIVLAGTGGSAQLQNTVPNSILKDQYVPGFALELLHKDLGIAAEMARESGVPLFLGSLAHQMYETMKGMGKGRMDFAVISTIYQDAANITIATGQPRREPQ